MNIIENNSKLSSNIRSIKTNNWRPIFKFCVDNELVVRADNETPVDTAFNGSINVKLNRCYITKDFCSNHKCPILELINKCY